ncbi:MAG: L-aspartate oxidase [Planctomycetota bacterium]
MVFKRDYLISFDTSKKPSITTDVLVIGSGVAGLRAAIEASNYGNVIVLTKDKLQETNTYYAQGGIASHINRPELIESHINDTLVSGHDLANSRIVKYIISNGVNLVKELSDWGMRFDKKGAKLDWAQEGGHSYPRIIHSGGDETGKNLLQTLINKVKSNRQIKTMEYCFSIDLLTENNPAKCYGALVSNKSRELAAIWAKQTILATGGAGQLYRETTNPDVATGDGVAMAYRAGCRLQDLEFVQFHPTALYVAGAARALISEAVRGEGALLRDKYGYRFMPDYHPKAELAPRDVVARSIINQMKLTNDTNIYLDLTHLPSSKTKSRFPGLVELCRRFDINISKDLIPVRPSAHYMIGGIATDINGKTDINDLFAAGECACCGFHGANRLGSNSLLEGLVMGYSTGRNAGKSASKQAFRHINIRYISKFKRLSDGINLGDVRNALKSLMWHNVSLERNVQGLEQALRKIDYWSGYVMEDEFKTKDGWELQNMLTLARLITLSALRRTESRGAHYRSDFPATKPVFKKHTTVSLVGSISHRHPKRNRLPT